MKLLFKYGLRLIILLFFVWLIVFMNDKDKAARMIGMDCWSNCDSNKTYVNGKLVK